MTELVQQLAADRFAGRRVGTPGGRAAAAFLADRLRSLGAEVGSDEFPVQNVRELYGTPVFRADARELEHRREFAESLASADLPEPRTGRLVAADAVEVDGRWIHAPMTDWARACDRAAAEGALGVLKARGVDGEGWMPKTIAGPASRGVPVLDVRADLLHELAGREVSVTASVPLRTVSTTGTNVHARFGDAPGILLTAHFDGVGDDPDRRLPAAADNASGVAAVLEAARVLREAGVEVAVSLVDAEEAGAWGSARHAPQVPPGTQVINLDGAARLDGAASVEAGGPAHGLLAVLDQAGKRTGVPLRAGAMASDNRRYAAAGLAAVGIGMGMPGYQTPAETPDRVDPGALVVAARLLISTVMLLRGEA
ncbi:MAG: M28 family peptidase [Catenulispora sp.]|nr:M28 family peptidase [Catenulispora sp.]